VVVLLGFGIAVLLAQRRVGLQRLDRDLAATHAQLAGMLREELREQDPPREAAENALQVIASGGYAVAIVGEDGAPLASNVDRAILDALRMGQPTAAGFATMQTGSGAWRVRTVHEEVESRPLLLVVASPLKDLERDQRNARDAILLGIPAALLLAGAGGPVAGIGRAPADHGDGRSCLGHRGHRHRRSGAAAARRRAWTTDRGVSTAWSRACAPHCRRSGQFMADASHELRSPVSVIRAAADVTLSREHRDEVEYREALTMAATQSRRLTSLVDDMLMLARADAGGYPLRLVDLRLRDVIDESCHAFSVLAADRRITLRSLADGDVSVIGDEELLRRLMANLLQNALHHTPPGGVVTVAVDAAATDVRIRV
jgi:signal transduction histidine kinase